MSFRNSFAAARAFALVSCLALSGFLASSGPASALTAAATVRDANSIQLGDVTYRLDLLMDGRIDGVAPDDAQAHESVVRVRAFVQSTGAVCLPTHDPGSAQRLATAQESRDEFSC